MKLDRTHGRVTGIERGELARKADVWYTDTSPSKETRMEMDRYIGDGVYAKFDGFGIMLDLRAQAPTLPITKILLEPKKN